MIRYVCCIARDVDANGPFVMIVKQRPDWQQNKINFPGGKVEAGESVIEAASREFLEETGVKTRLSDWQINASFEKRGAEIWEIHYCLANIKDVHLKAKTTTDEQIVLFHPNQLLEHQNDLIPNALWMCLFTCDPDRKHMVVTYW